MANWQYAWLTDQPYTTLGFSHPQPGLAAELAGVLGAGVFAAQSNEWSIALDRSRVNLGYVSGLMGDRGWEMFAVETRLQPGAMTPAQLQTNWYFKKTGPDKPANVSMASSAAAPASAPAAPTAPSYGQPTAQSYPDAAPAAPPSSGAASQWQQPATPATPAASQWQQPATPATPAASQWEQSSTPAAPSAPTPPAAPPGPEPASPSGGQAPPPGPGGYTPSGG
jgi:hypothetical protein